MGRTVLLLVLAALLLSLVSACERLPSPEQSGELVVAIRNGPSSYQVEGERASGFEHDLVEAFAASRHWRVRYVVAGDQGQLRSLLREGKVHLAASACLDDVNEFVYSQPLRETDPVLVGYADDLGLQTGRDDLNGKSVMVMYASPQADLLRQMAGTPAQFDIEMRTGVAEFELLRAVEDRQVQFAATDMLQYNLALNFLPDLEVALDLPGKIRFGWAFRRDDVRLQQLANEFIKTVSLRNGLLERLSDRYFGYIERIGPEGLAEFFKLMQTQLPRYRRLLADAQAASGIDWRLLAAVAYQESKWDPLATSPTNVRGMMMLTEDTADRLGVSDRLDARQSIRAGARYLADLKDQLPGEVKEPDRTWLALAGYNLGMGHLNAARAIAVKQKRDPNSWYEMKQVLPLLARPEYYDHLKSGMGRGGEAVILVENIRTYYDILNRFQPAVALKLGNIK